MSETAQPKPLGISRISQAKLGDVVKTHLGELIDSGYFQSGEKLPSEPELAQQFGVSRIVVREALQSLEKEGFVKRRHGVGTFVLSQAWKLSAGLEQLSSMTELIRSQGRTPGTRDLTLVTQTAGDHLAAMLGVPTASTVIVRRRVRTADGFPFAVDLSCFPARLFPNGIAPQDLGESIFADLQERYGVTVSRSNCNITAVPADREMAQSLEVPLRSALLRLEQTYFDPDHQPLYASISTIRSDILQFSVLRTR